MVLDNELPERFPSDRVWPDATLAIGHSDHCRRYRAAHCLARGPILAVVGQCAATITVSPYDVQVKCPLCGSKRRVLS